MHSLYHYQSPKLAVCCAFDSILLLTGSVNQISHAARPIGSPAQIWVVTSHQYGIYALVSQTSFCGETSGGVVKYRLFSQATLASQIEILTAVCMLFDRLRDESGHVRKNTLMVLTHLILNDMVKVKGQISEMATCLEDKDNRISDLAKLFFLELSKKVRMEKQNHENIRNVRCVFLGSLTREPTTMQLFFFSVNCCSWRLRFVCLFYSLTRLTEVSHFSSTVSSGEEGFYRDKVNFNLVYIRNCKMDYWSGPVIRPTTSRSAVKRSID